MTNDRDVAREAARDRLTAPIGGLRVDRYGRINEAAHGRTLEWTREYMAALARGDSETMQRLTRQPRTT